MNEFETNYFAALWSIDHCFGHIRMRARKFVWPYHHSIANRYPITNQYPNADLYTDSYIYVNSQHDSQSDLYSNPHHCASLTTFNLY